ncbi:dTDP-4-dehydrorhamnose reductase [Saccharibacillus sacchari]|uniref:dTDP-4-dehydrorhamnose reductase n=1 Tax=Saccharibacillus sacchari TaxID=456493 RepID=A0ACC6P756_9BACL
MLIIVTGAEGQLSKSVASILGCKHQVHSFSRKELDITDYHRVNEVITSLRPDIVIHSAAISGIDAAEENPHKAYLVNTYGTRNIAVAAEKVGAGLVYISSAYVFDGQKERYHELDKPRPLNVYGETKLGGEFYVELFHSRYWIIRTSWLYGENFIRTVLNIINSAGGIKVSDKQIGTPTSTTDLAKVIMNMIETKSHGIYHITSQGSCTKRQYYRHIASLLGVDNLEEKIIDAESDSKVCRPTHCVLEQKNAINQGFGILKPWNEALSQFINNS